MTEEQKVQLIELLKIYHVEQKEAAQGLAELKVHEEAAEVLIADLTGGPTEAEEADLLMCLVAKHMNDVRFIWAWEDRMHARNRDLLRWQEQFMKWVSRMA